MAVSWRLSVSQNWVAESTIFIVFLGARFLGQVVNKGNFGHPPKKGKFWLITEKLIFGYFLCFCFFFCFFFCLLFFSEGLRVKWGPKPSLLFLFAFFCFVLFCLFFLRVSFVLVFLYSFGGWFLFLEKKKLFSPKKSISVCFSVSPFVSP